MLQLAPATIGMVTLQKTREDGRGESVSWGHRSSGVIPASSALLQAASCLQLRAHGIRATEICFLGIYSEKVMEVDSTTWEGGLTITSL